MANKTIFLFISLFLILACTFSAPPSKPIEAGLETAVASTLQSITEAALPLYPGNVISFNNVTFTIPPELNVTVTPVVSTDTEYPFIYPLEEPMPEHVRIEFVNYPVGSFPQESNEILVFKAAEYAAFEEILGNQVNALLAGQDSAPPFPESLVHPDFYANTMSIRFQNGHGIRYLEHISTGITPISNEELFYYFQGITDDGKYFISARLHTTISFLVADSRPESPTPLDGVPFNWDPTSGFDFTQYRNEIAEKLNSAPSDAFNPSLNILDNLIKSLIIINSD